MIHVSDLEEQYKKLIEWAQSIEALLASTRIAYDGKTNEAFSRTIKETTNGPLLNKFAARNAELGLRLEHIRNQMFQLRAVILGSTAEAIKGSEQTSPGKSIDEGTTKALAEKLAPLTATEVAFRAEHEAAATNAGPIMSREEASRLLREARS